METQQFGRGARVSPYSGELDHMIDPGASGALDKSRLPVYRTFCDRRQEKRLLHAPQGCVECLGLIKVAHSQLDVRALETRSLGRIAHECANPLPHGGQLSDKFLSVVSCCSSDQNHKLPPVMSGWPIEPRRPITNAKINNVAVFPTKPFAIDVRTLIRCVARA